MKTEIEMFKLTRRRLELVKRGARNATLLRGDVFWLTASPRERENLIYDHATRMPEMAARHEDSYGAVLDTLTGSYRGGSTLLDRTPDFLGDVEVSMRLLPPDHENILIMPHGRGRGHVVSVGYSDAVYTGMSAMLPAAFCIAMLDARSLRMTVQQTDQEVDDLMRRMLDA